MIKESKALIEQIELDNAFISFKIKEIIECKDDLNVKDMVDIHRYSETRLFNLKSLSILNGSENNGR